LAQKAAVEGGLALCAFCARLTDQQRIDDADAKADASLLLEILTPIAKSWPSEHCLEANKHAIQILGGYGYTREYPVERFYRDNRLNHIHEGTLGIHGIDLLGRKVRMQNGAAMQILISRSEQTIIRASASGALVTEVSDLRSAFEVLRLATESAVSAKDADLGLANASLYLDGFGTVVVAWLWLWSATLAHDALRSDVPSDQDFYQGKIAACRYFFRYVLPHAIAQLRLVATLEDTCLKMTAAQFTGC
jgi:butyryl-CoA dehydrogenase